MRELAALDARLGARGESLADDEFQRLCDRRSELATFLADREYEALSYEERVDWWSAATHRHMRWQAESGIDQLLLFDRAWLEQARRRESQLLEILPRVCARFGMPFALIRRLVEHEGGSPEWRALRATVPETDYV
jgi:hypothetical protein